jgi:hypothetical protein
MTTPAGHQQRADDALFAVFFLCGICDGQQSDKQE